MSDIHKVDRDTTRQIWIQCLFTTLFINMLFVLILGIVILTCWGRNQSLTPDILQRKLRVGMTVQEAEYALAMHPGSIQKYLKPIDDEKKSSAISDSGIVGSFFVPQYRLELVFDKDNKLTDCYAEINWGTDEQYLPCELEEQ